MIKGKFVIPPGLADALDYHRADGDAQLRVALPGEIISFDKTKRTAQIQVGYNRVYNDGTVKPVSCPLVDVPVLTMQGGGVHAAFPIEPGDECLVVFADINIDNWYKLGGQQTPNDFRRHHIADGFALVGPNSLANPLATLLSPTEGGIASATAKVAIDEATGLVTIQANALNLLTVLTTMLNSLQTALSAIGADPALQVATKTAANNAAAAVTTAVTELEALLQ